MNILIYGAGAIGCHLSYVLDQSHTNIFIFMRNKKYKIAKKNGFELIIMDNEKIKKKINIFEKKNISFCNNLNELSKINFDYIFFTHKLVKNYQKPLNDIKKIINKKTSIIFPCTILPGWWLNKYGDPKFKSHVNKNAIGMSMWISGKMIANKIVIKHTQRGYPLKEVFSTRRKEAEKLRNIIKIKSKSPILNSIYGEIYLKVINSFAFNIIAIKYNQNNSQLLKNRKAIDEIKLIMSEFDNLVISMKLKLEQSIQGRINQTLSSTKHTMSMLSDLKEGKNIELLNQWKSLKKIRNAKGDKIKNSINILNNVKKIIKKN